MIRKKDYNNREAIFQDKLRFMELAERTGIGELIIMGFTDEYYQNLNSFKENLRELRKFAKEELKKERAERVIRKW